jgi:hypothetical protein
LNYCHTPFGSEQNYGFLEVVVNLLTFGKNKHNPSNVVKVLVNLWPESIVQPVKQALKRQQGSVYPVVMI